MCSVEACFYINHSQELQIIPPPYLKFPVEFDAIWRQTNVDSKELEQKMTTTN